MTETQLYNLLTQLCQLPAETEWVEFKEAKRSFDFDDLGRYLSALCNEANLNRKAVAWLVFGVEDKHHQVVGTGYKPQRPELDKLKHDVAQHTTSRHTFSEIYELNTADGRVILFQIPAAPRNLPIAWKGHYYGRDGESLTALSLYEIEQIRGQTKEDWSAQICPDATLNDLEPAAVAKARHEYKNKFPHLADDVEHWDDSTFLNKAKVTRNGQITRAAIILLGRDEAEHHLSPAIAKITWVLRNEAGADRDYEHFGPPFILNTDAMLSKIRNLKYRYLPDNTLFPTEVTQYDPYVIREALHNCIAHQDYTLAGKITVVENPDDLLFTNPGRFIPGSVENVLQRDAPPDEYRNPFLVQAMTNLNMIDTIGSGIKRMFITQRQRYFPLPDYDLSDPDRVMVRICGKILDENYTRLLIRQTDLPLKTVIALDRVQKKRSHELLPGILKELKAANLIEGRKPHYFVSTKIAQITDKKAEYTRFKAFDKKYYQDLVLNFLRQHGQANRHDIDELLINKLPDFMNERQKRIKINNILSEMSHKMGLIKNAGSRFRPIWTRRENL